MEMFLDPRKRSPLFFHNISKIYHPNAIFESLISIQLIYVVPLSKSDKMAEEEVLKLSLTPGRANPLWKYGNHCHGYDIPPFPRYDHLGRLPDMLNEITQRAKHLHPALKQTISHIHDEERLEAFQQVTRRLAGCKKAIQDSPWKGLTELTQKNGEYCADSVSYIKVIIKRHELTNSCSPQHKHGQLDV